LADLRRVEKCSSLGGDIPAGARWNYQGTVESQKQFSSLLKRFVIVATTLPLEVPRCVWIMTTASRNGQQSGASADDKGGVAGWGWKWENKGKWERERQIPGPKPKEKCLQFWARLLLWENSVFPFVAASIFDSYKQWT